MSVTGIFEQAARPRQYSLGCMDPFCGHPERPLPGLSGYSGGAFQASGCSLPGPRRALTQAGPQHPAGCGLAGMCTGPGRASCHLRATKGLPGPASRQACGPSAPHLPPLDLLLGLHLARRLLGHRALHQPRLHLPPQAWRSLQPSQHITP